ncbi:hypothetical protein F5Y08DRAFT_86122 [Xylaria arbuscula]|nr:hypothetical protein F5Y08DRAFT_86122 [Xylaria arbuscula]
MKAIFALIKYFFSFFDCRKHNHHRDKAHEKNRLQNGFDSTDSTRPAYMDLPPERIAASWMDHNKLTQLLDSKFGSHYTLACRSDIYYLYSSAKLTDGEIMACKSRGAQR